MVVYWIKHKWNLNNFISIAFFWLCGNGERIHRPFCRYKRERKQQENTDSSLLSMQHCCKYNYLTPNIMFQKKNLISCFFILNMHFSMWLIINHINEQFGIFEVQDPNQASIVLFGLNYPISHLIKIYLWKNLQMSRPPTKASKLKKQICQRHLQLANNRKVLHRQLCGVK
jgi:hypothetical protein